MFTRLRTRLTSVFFLAALALGLLSMSACDNRPASADTARSHERSVIKAATAQGFVVASFNGYPYTDYRVVVSEDNLSATLQVFPAGQDPATATARTLYGRVIEGMWKFSFDGYPTS